MHRKRKKKTKNKKQKKNTPKNKKQKQRKNLIQRFESTTQSSVFEIDLQIISSQGVLKVGPVDKPKSELRAIERQTGKCN